MALVDVKGEKTFQNIGGTIAESGAKYFGTSLATQQSPLADKYNFYTVGALAVAALIGVFIWKKSK